MYRLTVGLHPHWLVQISLICSKTIFVFVYSTISPLVGSNRFIFCKTHVYIKDNHAGKVGSKWKCYQHYIEGQHPVWINDCSKSICVYSTTIQVCSNQLNLFKPICVQVQPHWLVQIEIVIIPTQHTSRLTFTSGWLQPINEYTLHPEWLIQLSFMCSKRICVKYNHYARCTHGSNQLNLFKIHLSIYIVVQPDQLVQMVHIKNELSNWLQYMFIYYKCWQLRDWFKVEMYPTQYIVSLHPV